MSFTLGILSVVFFANCFLPQIILNFVNGSSEGLSVGMILVWSLGDLCNIIGVLLTGAVSLREELCHLCDLRACCHKLLFLQMPTQFMMAILFCTCDGILNFQNIYYSYWGIPRRLRALQQEAQQQQPHSIAEANELEALLATTSKNAQAESHMSTSRSSSTSTSSTPRSEASPDHPHVPSSTTAVRRLQGLSAGMELQQLHVDMLYQLSCHRSCQRPYNVHV